MKNINVFVFDLDGTLLTSKKEITVNALKKLQSLHNIGHKIIFATARPPRAVQTIIEKIQIPLGLVYYNGGQYILDKNEIMSHDISNSIFNEIYNFINENDANAFISIEQNDMWYTCNNFDYKSFFDILIGPILISEHELRKKSPTKILLNNSMMSLEIQELFSNKCNVLITDNNSLVQIMSIEASKENAVSKIVKEMGLNNSNVICFGDDFNDIGLFKISGKSIAMGNAIEELKKIASFVTETNDDDGVYKYLEKYHPTTALT